MAALPEERQEREKGNQTVNCDPFIINSSLRHLLMFCKVPAGQKINMEADRL
jgi:hypothetical protein